MSCPSLRETIWQCKTFQVAWIQLYTHTQVLEALPQVFDQTRNQYLLHRRWFALSWSMAESLTERKRRVDEELAELRKAMKVCKKESRDWVLKDSTRGIVISTYILSDMNLEPVVAYFNWEDVVFFRLR